MSSEAEEMVRLFRSHREVTQQVAGAIPGDQGAFQPWPGALRVYELVAHMAVAHNRFTRLVRGLPPHPDAPTGDLAAAIGLLAERTAEDLENLGALDHQQLSGEIPFREHRLNGWSLLALAREHEAHHKGQLILTGRILGAPLPQPLRWRVW